MVSQAVSHTVADSSPTNLGMRLQELSDQGRILIVSFRPPQEASGFLRVAGSEPALEIREVCLGWDMKQQEKLA